MGVWIHGEWVYGYTVGSTYCNLYIHTSDFHVHYYIHAMILHMYIYKVVCVCVVV